MGLAVTHHACVGRWVRVSPSPRLAHLVYPVRQPGDPGLGVHATLDLGGSVRFGPDAVWAPASVDDEASAAAYAAGLLADPPPPAFRAAIEALFGPLGDATLRWDDAGVRAKLAAPGDLDADFEVREDALGGLHLLGIESPGLTAALALAEAIRARIA
jgi:L-2-hydroxyglutarate oxidase LhgO